MSFLENIYSGIGFSFKDSSKVGKVEIIDLMGGESLGRFAYSHGEFYKVLPRSRYLFKIFDDQNNLVQEKIFVLEEKKSKVFYEQL